MSAGAAAQARIETTRASRYLVQLCRHASRIGRGHLGIRPHGPRRPDRQRPSGLEVHGSDTFATVTATPWGRCTLEATPQALVVRVVAVDEDGLRRIQDLLTDNLTRFGRRDRLTITWQPADPADAGPPEDRTPEDQTPERPAGPRRGRVVLAAIAGLALMIGIHLGLAGGVAAIMNWLGWTVTGVALVAVIVVVAHLGIPALLIRRRQLGKQSAKDAR